MPEAEKDANLEFKSDGEAADLIYGTASHALPAAEAQKALEKSFAYDPDAKVEDYLPESKHYPDEKPVKEEVVAAGGTDTGVFFEGAYASDKPIEELIGEKHSYVSDDRDVKNARLTSPNPTKQADRALLQNSLRQIPHFKGSPAENFWVALMVSVERDDAGAGGGASFAGELIKIVERTKKEDKAGDLDYVRGLLVSKMSEMAVNVTNNLKPVWGGSQWDELPLAEIRLVGDYLGTKIGREKQLLEVGEALGLLKDVFYGWEKRGGAVRAIQERFNRYFNQPEFDEVWQDARKKYLMPISYDLEEGRFKANEKAVKGDNEKVAGAVAGLNGSLLIGRLLYKFEVVQGKITRGGREGSKDKPILLPHWPLNDESVWQADQAKLPPGERAFPFRYERSTEGQFTAVVDEKVVKPDHPVIVEALERLKETIPDLIFVQHIAPGKKGDNSPEQKEVVAVGDVKMWTNDEVAQVVEQMRQDGGSREIGARVNGKPLFLEVASMKRYVDSQLPDSMFGEDLEFVLMIPADGDVNLWQEFGRLAAERGQEIIIVQGQVARQTADRVADYIMTRAGIKSAAEASIQK